MHLDPSYAMLVGLGGAWTSIEGGDVKQTNLFFCLLGDVPLIPTFSELVTGRGLVFSLLDLHFLRLCQLRRP